MGPGLTKNKFTLVFKEQYFNKGDLLQTSDNVRLKLTKVYKYNWWRKLLNFLGIQFKMFNCVKVEEVENAIKDESNPSKGFL